MDFQKFIDKIKEFEGFRAHAYKCPAGVWTIGYGRCGSGVGPGSVTSRAAEDKWILNYVNVIYNDVKNLTSDYGYKFDDHQLQALTSFAYNCGIGNKNKGLIALLKSGSRSVEEISETIPKYNKGGGVVLSGLVRRRAWEKDLFDGKFESVLLDSKKTPTAKDLQTLLNTVGGFDLVVDGKIGKKTTTAAYNYILSKSEA